MSRNQTHAHVLGQEIKRLVDVRRVLEHNLAQGIHTEHAEAAGAAQHRAQHVLRSLLEPVANRVVKVLVPNKRAATKRVRAPADSADPSVSRDHHQQRNHVLRAKLDVGIRGEDVCVVRVHAILPPHRVNLVTHQVVHVHHLRPPLALAHFLRVLQVHCDRESARDLKHNARAKRRRVPRALHSRCGTSIPAAAAAAGGGGGGGVIIDGVAVVAARKAVLRLPACN